jgi:hypothetical protein
MTSWFFFHLNGFPDGGAQVVNRAAVNAGDILNRMEGLCRAPYTQHPAFDKRDCRTGVALYQFLDAYFRINLYHDRMIASSMPGVFALAQT